MEMILKKEKYSGYSVIWSGMAGNEFGCDCVIPDTMPDVGSVIDVEGTVLLRSRDTEDDRVALEASVSAVVLYHPEGEGPVCSLPVNIPVQLSMDTPGVSLMDEDVRTVFRLRLRALDARMVNSRKISVRADVEADAVCYSRTVLRVACQPEEGQTPAHLLTGSTAAVTVCDIREKIFVVTDSYSLPTGRNAARILSQRVEVLTEEAKFVSGKVVFHGRAKAFILFGDEKGEPLCSVPYETEFSQIMEADGEGDVQPEVHIALTGIYFDMPDVSDAQGRISAELHMAAHCVCRKTDEMQYISDAYSNCLHLIPEMESIGICTQARPISMRQTVTGKAEPAVGEGEVLSVAAMVGTISRMENGVKTSVGVRILTRNGGQYAVSRCRLGVEFSLEIPAACDLSSVAVKVTDVYFASGNSTADTRVTLQLDGLLSEKKSIECVGCILADEEDVRDFDSYPTVTLVRAPQDANLWSLAKKHHSTIEAIHLANEGKTEGLLLIPKTR